MHLTFHDIHVPVHACWHFFLNTGTTICECKSTYKDDHPYLKEYIEKI